MKARFSGVSAAKRAPAPKGKCYNTAAQNGALVLKRRFVREYCYYKYIVASINKFRLNIYCLLPGIVGYFGSRNVTA